MLKSAGEDRGRSQAPDPTPHPPTTNPQRTANWGPEAGKESERKILFLINKFYLIFICISLGLILISVATRP